MKTKKLVVIAIGVAILIGIAGCTPQDTGLNDNNKLNTRLNQNNSWDDNGMNDMTGNGLNTGNNTGINGVNGMDSLNNGMTRNNRMMTTSLGDLNTNASDLARKIGNLPEVDSATVVLTNDTAVVGVDLKGTNTNNNIGTALRQKIERMVKDETNNGITEVSITSDPDLFTRIRTMSTGMNRNTGTMGEEITNDIQQLIRDITPNGMNRTNMNNR